MKTEHPPRNETRYLDLIERNRGRISRICQAWTRSSDEFQDLRSEIFLQLWRSLPSLSAEQAEDSWLYRVALNTALLHGRSRGRRAKTEEFDESQAQPVPATAQVELENRDQRRGLWRLMTKLPEVERTLVTLWLEQLSYSQISDITGLSENRVGVSIHRARKKLKRWMEEGLRP